MAEKNETSWKLSAYLDGELSEAEAEQMALALDQDTALRRELAELEATRELLMRLPRHRGGRDLTERIMAAAEQLAARPFIGVGRAAIQMRRLATAAVVLVAAAAGVITILTLIGPESPVGPPVAVVPTVIPPEHGEAYGPPETPAAENGATREVIFTHDLGMTQRDVERVLLTNGLRPETWGESSRMAKGRMSRDGGSNFRFSRQDADTVSYEVTGTQEQVIKLQTGLQRIRDAQFVAQARPRIAAPAPPEGVRTKWLAKAKAPSLSDHKQKKGAKDYGGKDLPGPGGAAAAKIRLRKPAAPGAGQDAPTDPAQKATILAAIDDGKKRFVRKFERLLHVIYSRWSPRAVASEINSQITTQPKQDLIVQGESRDGVDPTEDKRGRQVRAQKRAGGRPVATSRRALALVGSDVRRLIITLSKRTLAEDAAARKAAEMKRSVK